MNWEQECAEVGCYKQDMVNAFIQLPGSLDITFCYVCSAHRSRFYKAVRERVDREAIDAQ